MLPIFSDIKDEKEVLSLTTSEEKCVVHFYHEDFRRCAIMDTHLQVILSYFIYLLVLLYITILQCNPSNVKLPPILTKSLEQELKNH